MILISGNIPSSKNSKVNGKYLSKTCKDFLRHYDISYYSASKKEVKFYKKRQNKYSFQLIAQEFAKFTKEDYPLIVSLTFIMPVRYY